MRKKILTIVFVMAIATIAVWNVSKGNKNVAMEDVILENVEAFGSSTEYYETHCGNRLGTQCQSSITGPPCQYYHSCP